MRTALLGLAALLVACGTPGAPDGGARDAGRDGGSTDAGDAGADASVDAGPRPCVGPPGLYSDEECSVLATGVRPYEPRFALW